MWLGWGAGRIIKHPGYCRFAAVAFTGLEMGYANIQQVQLIDILRYHNRIMLLKPDTLPKLVYEGEKSLGFKGWISDVNKITSALHMPPPNAQIIYDTENAEHAAMELSNKWWWEDALTTSKLDMYVQFTKKDTKYVIAKMKQNRHTRSAASRLAAGILSIEIEIRKYANGKREKWLCKVCGLNIT